MGAVYEALNERVNSIVAVKETFAETETQREAFEQEAKRLANLDHDAFPKVMDHFFEGDGQYLVMELIRGTDLAELMTLRESPFAATKVLEWADQLLDALEELHAYPIIHRDIKPANLKLTRKGKIKLLDFGIAKGVAGQMTVRTDRSGAGYTPHYSPLEQMLRSGSHWSEGLSIVDLEAVERISQQATDGRADLYALGATLYHLMTGVIPPDAATRALCVWTGKPDGLRPAHEHNSQVPPAVSDALRQTMALERNDRPATARDLRRMLREAINQPLFQPPTELSPEIEDRAHERREAANRRYVQDEAQALQRSPVKGSEGSGEEETTVLGTVKEKPPSEVPAIAVQTLPRLEAPTPDSVPEEDTPEQQPLAPESDKNEKQPDVGGHDKALLAMRGTEVTDRLGLNSSKVVQNSNELSLARGPLAKHSLIISAILLTVFAGLAFVNWKIRSSSKALAGDSDTGSRQTQLSATASPTVESFKGLSPSRNTEPFLNGTSITTPSGIVLDRIEPGRSRLLSNEKAPRATVKNRFYFGIVKQRNWKAVMGETAMGKKSDLLLFARVDLPMWDVSLRDKREFIRKLNLKKDGYSYYLPTRAETNYACDTLIILFCEDASAFRVAAKLDAFFVPSLKEFKLQLNPLGPQLKSLIKETPLKQAGS